MRFLADLMLGRLARWLRILGFDTAFYRRTDDAGPLAAARLDGRILLTRNTSLAVPGGRTAGRLLIESDDWRKQVGQVLDELDLRDAVRPYSRCVACNAELKHLDRAENLVPPYVSEHGTEFSLCPGCGRVYWKGTHCSDMGTKLISIMDSHKPKGDGHARRNDTIT